MALILFAIFACSGGSPDSSGGDDSGTTPTTCTGGSGAAMGGSEGSYDTLPYFLYVPSSLGPCAPLLLYGHAGNRPGAVTDGVWEDPHFTGLQALADEVGFVLVVPGANAAGNPHDWDFMVTPKLDAIAEAVATTVDLDRSRIWFAGMSAGGHMAAYYGLYDPSVITGVAVVAAGLGGGGFDYPSPEPDPKLPFYVAHDPKDQVIDYSYSVTLAGELSAHGHDYTFVDWSLGVEPDHHGWNPDLGAAIFAWLDAR